MIIPVCLISAVIQMVIATFNLINSEMIKLNFMKLNFWNFLLAIFLMTTLMSFTLEKKDEIRNEQIVSNQNGWGAWKTTSCFRYLQYQIKKDDYAGKWFIRFKNNYNQSISMSIEVKGNTGTREDSGRFTVRSGDTSSQYYFVDSNATRIEFTLNKVKFGDTSWGGPYAECDY